MEPSEAIKSLIQQAKQLRENAKQALSGGILSDDLSLAGDIALKTIIPYGWKGVTKKTARKIMKNHHEKTKAEWLSRAHHLLGTCESTVREISENTTGLKEEGNSSKLVRKFNRVRSYKTPIKYLDTLIDVLEQIKNLDLIWNFDIPQELVKRKLRTREPMPKLEGLMSSIDPYDRDTIKNYLQKYPNVLESILGALDSLNRANRPDAFRHCITSCRVAIEAACMSVGSNNDWKTALNNIFTSKTDQRTVKSTRNYLSGKGAHGGHTPTKQEAEYGLKMTIATLELILGKKV